MAVRVYSEATGEIMDREAIEREISAINEQNRALEHVLAPGRTESIRLGGIIRSGCQNERIFSMNLSRLGDLELALQHA